MKVDVEGNIYCTGPGGVWVTDPQGNHLGRLLVPEDCANFGFGDPDYRTIYFTARSSIYRMRVEIPGLPTYPIPGISN
jgi:sugar lactone lactonase YvrE